MAGVLWDLSSPLPKSLETSGHRGGHQHTGADALKQVKTGESKMTNYDLGTSTVFHLCCFNPPPKSLETSGHRGGTLAADALKSR